MSQKTIVVAPDSFKGTMSSIEVCDIMAAVIKDRLPGVKVRAVPIADGGEGTLDALEKAVGGSRRRLRVTGPLGRPVQAGYLLLNDGSAVIEMAEAAGLPLLGGELNVMATTTYGVGELIRDALKNRPRAIIVALGGSASNDGGAGACAALGVKFLDAFGRAFVPVGGNLKQIAKIDCSGLHPLLQKTPVTLMTDVMNPLCGEQGAAQVFSPQKGADPSQVRELDQGLAHLAACLEEACGISVLNVPGAGAAGGMGGGLYALLGARIRPGIDRILDLVNFNGLLEEAGLVFTGEGRIDAQSLGGKTISGVARRARAQRVPVIAVVGDIGDNLDGLYEAGISGIVSINRVAGPYEELRARARDDLALTMADALRLLQLGRTLALDLKE